MAFRIIFAACAALLAGTGPALAQRGTDSSVVIPPAATWPYLRYIETRWPASADVAITPAQVAAMIARNGARRTVARLWGDGNAPTRWNTVGHGIAHGDPAWLAVAARISPGTDAGSSDDFAAAVQDAVVTNAAGALRLLAAIPMGAGACDENGFETPPEQAAAYFAAARASVETVNDPALAAIKAQCLASLGAGEAALAGRGASAAPTDAR